MWHIVIGMQTLQELKKKPFPTNPEDFKSFVCDLLNHIETLESKLSLLNLRKFGRSSERYEDPNQQDLFDEVETLNSEVEDDESEDDSINVDSHSRKKRRRKIEMPDNIERKVVVHDLEDKTCSCCGRDMVEIGEDKTEKLDLIPAKLCVHQDVYKKYACQNSACDGKPKQAAVTPVAVPRIKATMGTLSFIAIQKYLYGMPLYRLEFFFSSLGVIVSRYVMSNWMIKLAEALKPIYLTLEEQLMESRYIHIDETRLQVLKEEGRKPTTQSYAWVRARGDPNAPPIILYHYSPSRSAKVATSLLDGFTGYLQSDDYEGYACALKGNTDVTRLLCWDHARRYFFEAHKAIPESNRKDSIADQVLRQIKKLYKIEAAIKDKTPEKRLNVRQNACVVRLNKIKLLLEENRSTLSNHSLTAKAIYYTLDNWKQLIVYTTDPVLNISNSPAEQAIRPFVVGRKAWLFSNTPAGAEASMILYSLIITAKANGLNPFSYLKKTLKKLPQIETAEDLVNLLPLKQHG